MKRTNEIAGGTIPQDDTIRRNCNKVHQHSAEQHLIYRLPRQTCNQLKVLQLGTANGVSRSCGQYLKRIPLRGFFNLIRVQTWVVWYRE